MSEVDSLFKSRDSRLTVTECDRYGGQGVGVSFVVKGPSRNYLGGMQVALGPEEIAHLAHALNQWIARFTSNA